MSQKDGFTGGFLLGTAIGSLIGAIVATLMINRQTPDDELLIPSQEINNSSPTKELSNSPEIEQGRKSLEQKIAQLNHAIDEVLVNINPKKESMITPKPLIDE